MSGDERITLLDASTLRAIALAEIVGGALVIIGYRLMAFTPGITLAAWQHVLGVLFGGGAVLAGVLLLVRRPLGVRLSLLVQAMQVVAITWVPAFSFVALAGPKLRLVLATTGVHLRAGFGGEFLLVPWARDGTLTAIAVQVELGGGYSPSPLAESTTTLGINLLALVFMGHLWRASTRVVMGIEPTPVVLRPLPDETR